MSVFNGVRVRGFGTRNLSWKVGYVLSGESVFKKEFEKVARPARVTGLEAYFDAGYAVSESEQRRLPPSPLATPTPWRNQNSYQSPTSKNFVGVAITGPSREGFYFYLIYSFEGGAGSQGRPTDPPRIYPNSEPQVWTLEYDPAANGGKGRITVAIDGKSSSVDLK